MLLSVVPTSVGSRSGKKNSRRRKSQYKEENVKSEIQQLISVKLRTELEHRLARIFRIDPVELPKLPLSDIVSLIFTLHGDTNSLASPAGTSAPLSNS